MVAVADDHQHAAVQQGDRLDRLLDAAELLDRPLVEQDPPVGGDAQALPQVPALLHLHPLRHVVDEGGEGDAVAAHHVLGAGAGGPDALVGVAQAAALLAARPPPGPAAHAGALGGQFVGVVDQAGAGPGAAWQRTPTARVLRSWQCHTCGPGGQAGLQEAAVEGPGAHRLQRPLHHELGGAEAVADGLGEGEAGAGGEGGPGSAEALRPCATAGAVEQVCPRDPPRGAAAGRGRRRRPGSPRGWRWRRAAGTSSGGCGPRPPARR